MTSGIYSVKSLPGIFEDQGSGYPLRVYKVTLKWTGTVKSLTKGQLESSLVFIVLGSYTMMPRRSTMVPRRSSMVLGILRRNFCRKHKVNPKIENMSKIINVVQNYKKIS